MNRRSASKKVFTVKIVIISVSVIAILAVIAVAIWQERIKNSRNEIARQCLQQIALAQMASETSHCWEHSCPPFFTDGVKQAPEAAIQIFVNFGFRPDPLVAFHIIPSGVVNDQISKGYVAFAAHNSVGSTVYTYNNIDAIGIVEAREGVEYGGITVIRSVAPLFRYKYDPSTKMVEKLPNETKFGPDPKDTKPARMVVAVAAE